MEVDTKLRFYFSESLAQITMPVLQSRLTFLYGESKESDGSKTGSQLAAAAQALASKTGRKEIPLGELMGAI